MTILYFTSTGNSLYVAKKIGGKLYSIPQAVKNNKFDFKDDEIGIIFPNYALCVPPFVNDFLSKAKLECKYLFAIITYGVYKGAIIHDLISTTTSVNFDYVSTIKMVENYLPMFEMKEQIAKTSNQSIEDKLSKIISDISKHKHKIPHDCVFNRLLTSAHKKQYPYNSGVGVTKNYNIQDTCNGCGTCVQVCPVDNIKLSNSKPVFLLIALAV